MFWTIIKEIYEEFIKKGFTEIESKEKSCYNSVEMKRNWSSEQIELFTYWDCSGIQTLITNKKIVSFINEHNRSLNGDYYFVRPHFRLKKDEKLSYIKSDDRHTTAQHILAALILQKESIKINYRDIPFYLNDLDLNLKNKTTEHILEQSFIDKKIGINRRADLCFELEEPNLTFGKGLIFEIINKESMQSIKEKSKDWAKAGYSLITIPIENFDFENFSLKKDKYLIMYRLFDDINIYIDLMQKIKDNEPLIDNFNKNVIEIERKMFLWRSGRHNYKFDDDEKVNKILLYCMGKEKKKFKGSKKLILNCYDYSNTLVDIDIWDKNPLFNFLNNLEINQNLIKIECAYFKEYLGDVNLVLNQYSKIKLININDIEYA